MQTPPNSLGFWNWTDMYTVVSDLYNANVEDELDPQPVADAVHPILWEATVTWKN